jgi:cysteine-rich repeat protein
LSPLASRAKLALAGMRWVVATLSLIALGCGHRSLAPDGVDGGPIGLGGATGGGGVAGQGGTVGGGPGAAAPDASVEARVDEELCGNGQLDPGEECDDGNRYLGDGCSPLCQIECSWVCGTCGPAPPCTHALACGDGVRTRGEACDDGNLVAGDGCSPTCQLEPGWQCPVPGAACKPICGDDVKVGGEACDDGNRLDGDGCSAICLEEPTTLRCGDGIVSGDETCDHGALNGTAGDICGPDCNFWHVCGDGVLDPGEACDLGPLGNTSLYGTSGCTPDCQHPHYCGDGIVDTDFGEQCDLGANNGQPTTLCTDNCFIVII